MSTNLPLSIGDTFPDIELIDHDGNPWRPSAALGTPLVLILHRHLA
jgi:peroxiredoxin